MDLCYPVDADGLDLDDDEDREAAFGTEDGDPPSFNPESHVGGEELMKAYERVLSLISKAGLKWAWKKGEQVPDIPDEVMDAFASKKLKKIGMTRDAFQCRLGLWRAFNLSSQNQNVLFPLPAIARIIPLNVATWNAGKGGGDAVTGLDDACQERLGIRTENNVCTARELVNIGVVFHSITQKISGDDDLETYPTIYHYRNAASHRATMKDSLETLVEDVIEMAGSGKQPSQDMGNNNGTTDEETIDMGIFVPKSPSDATQRPTRGLPKTPDQTSVAFLSPKTGKTPGKGQSLSREYPEHDERAKNCGGALYHRRVMDPTDSDKRDMRRPCHVCSAKTDWFCNGCRRYLCSKPSGVITTKDGVGGKATKKRKLPNTFMCKVPELDSDSGKPKVDEEGEPIFVEEYGQYTCYIHAHRSKLKETSTEKNKLVMQDISKKRRSM